MIAVAAADDARDVASVRVALTDLVPRVCALIRTIHAPDAHAVGEWNAIETAVHLSHAYEALGALAGGQSESPLRDLRDLAGMTTSMVAADEVRDPDVIATRIEAAAARFLDALTREVPESRPWLIEGMRASMPTFGCHVLNETLVHGFDIARSQRRPWHIARPHARLVIEGFLLRVMAMLEPHALVEQDHAHGRACRRSSRCAGMKRAAPRVAARRPRARGEDEGVAGQLHPLVAPQLWHL